LPGVAQGDLDASLERLMALPEAHLFRAVADKSYRPKMAPDKAQWERAFPLFVQILAADPRALTDQCRTLCSRRAALARHLYWLAGDDPTQLEPDRALDQSVIERSALVTGARASYRSQLVFRSQIRSFQAGFPNLFLPKAPPRPVPDMDPISDADFLVALNAADTFRHPRTTDYVRALLLLGRGAGVDGYEARYVLASDVHRRRGAGLWVSIRRPPNVREVPVLARFQVELERLALRAGSHALIGGLETPAPYTRPGNLIDVLKRRLRGQHSHIEVSAERLRRAWLLEQLTNLPELSVFLEASVYRTMHGLEALQRRCPQLSADPVRDAYLLGGKMRPRRVPASPQHRRGDHE
jgi:hypothetical protein